MRLFFRISHLQPFHKLILSKINCLSKKKINVRRKINVLQENYCKLSGNLKKRKEKRIILIKILRQIILLSLWLEIILLITEKKKR